jgi:hypothetical protein
MPMPSKMTEKYIGTTCKHCGMGRMIEFPNENEWNLFCNECNAFMFCYDPLPHQQAFHADSSKYRMFAGGYG